MMAQLIKIRQCISRYQVDLLRYANRYIWLKNRRQVAWEEKQGRGAGSGRNQAYEQGRDAELFNSWLFDMQMEWATRTAEEQSECPDDVSGQLWLRMVLSRINDLSFLMYEPVLDAQTAAVQLDSLLITNDTVWCVRSLSGEKGSVFQGVSERKWREITTGSDRELLSPIISLRRTKAVIQAYLKNRDIDMATEAVVFAPDSFIEFVQETADISFVDSRNAASWFDRMSRHSLLMKKNQIAVAEALLADCETIADSRFQEKDSLL